MTHWDDSENVAVITGASSGIGRELALQAAERGASLVLVSRSAARLAEVADACRQRGGQAIAVPTDVGNPQQCQQMIKQAVKTFGGIDYLINNAGFTMFARFSELPSPELIERMTRVNYLGSVYCTYYALPYLRQRQGRVVAVISGAGRMRGPFSTGYGGSKHAMRGFFESLRVELKPDRVSVTTVYPGFIDTGIYDRIEGADGHPVPGMKEIVPAFAMMSVERCCRKIWTAARKRKRQSVPGLTCRLGIWGDFMFPGLTEFFCQRMLPKEPPRSQRPQALDTSA
ncbi:SDR family oxidoreductase [Roseimaritima ulvae]|uniref:Putative oxidoreductase n=1 Tax=Roseimaritima ulvae TaxID=980254 RepID=A0A5B9QNE0_9BACT|nr:SDR family oxidoreductase [Roseimaritima ulvae]QEG40627.1 putative oxidoreductase [Roseimaritima ulvae]